MKNRFGVAVCTVDVTARFEVVAIICVVVDLPVVSDLECTVFVGHRLMAARHVDDAQTSMPQANIAVDEDPNVVRPAMRNYIAHPLEDTTVQRFTRLTRQRY